MSQSPFEPIKDTEQYRDSVATIDQEGKRVWLYPKKPHGSLYNYRIIVSIILLIIFFALPFVKFNGEPFFMINIPMRKFILFGLVFGPQDTFLFALFMITFFVFIVLFTVVFGRLWCGWTCPQTIFMEMIFRRIEYWIEGDAQQQRNLNKMAWNGEKWRKRGLKYTVFFLISFLISNTFLAYVIGVDALYEIITSPINQHLGGLAAILIFTGVFFFVFSYMREQICIVVCPYGRLQGVLLDRNSIVVAYDNVRGEPRGKVKKNQPVVETHGDCIDCHACVHVCPTGIDIRNGTQLECINCTACIDACDAIMDKIEKPRGLIRYASLEGIQNKIPLKFTPRIAGYSAVLLLLLLGSMYSLFNRNDTETTFLRSRGMLYQEVGTDSLSNLYNFKTANKTHDDLPIKFVLESHPEGKIKIVGNTTSQITAIKETATEGEFFVVLPRTSIKKRKTEIVIGIYSGDRKLETERTAFLGTTRPYKAPETNK